MKRTLLFAALALPLAAAAQTKWDLATAYADTEFQTRNVRLFADDVKKLSGGKLDITVHSAGSLIKNPELKRSVQTGLVPMVEFFISNFGGENPMFEVDALPYLAVNYKEVRALWRRPARRSPRASPSRASGCCTRCPGRRRPSTPRSR